MVHRTIQLGVGSTCAVSTQKGRTVALMNIPLEAQHDDGQRLIPSPPHGKMYRQSWRFPNLHNAWCVQKLVRDWQTKRRPQKNVLRMPWQSVPIHLNDFRPHQRPKNFPTRIGRHHFSLQVKTRLVYIDELIIFSKSTEKYIHHVVEIVTIHGDA